MIANKLKPGDEIRVIAPSRNLTEVWHVAHHHAVDFWHKEGFNLTFSKNSCEIGKFHSSSIASRVEDIHEAFCDPNVKMIITCLGGFNTNQLLRHLDYDLIAKNPKILCGYSDITALHNAIYAKTGISALLDLTEKLSTQDKHLRIALSRMDLLPLCPLKLL